jgi:hypothetical protein
MQLKDLREFLTKIPLSFDEYEMVNGEVGLLDAEDENSAVYRLDKPIIAMYIDESSKEICFFHQTQEYVKQFVDNTDGLTEDTN